MSMSPAASAGSSPVPSDKSRGSSKEQAWVIPDDDLPKSPGSADSPIDCEKPLERVASDSGDDCVIIEKEEEDDLEKGDPEVEIPDGAIIDPYAASVPGVVDCFSPKPGLDRNERSTCGAQNFASTGRGYKDDPEKFVIKEKTPGDHSCLYRCLLEQLLASGKKFPDLQSQEDIRSQLAKFLRGKLEPFQMKEEWQQLVHVFFQAHFYEEDPNISLPEKRPKEPRDKFSAEEQDKILDKYADRLMDPTVWGGECEILMAAIVFGVKIAEYEWIPSEKEFILQRVRVPRNVKHEDLIINLSHEPFSGKGPKNHYNYFRKQN